MSMSKLPQTIFGLNLSTLISSKHASYSPADNTIFTNFINGDPSFLAFIDTYHRPTMARLREANFGITGLLALFDFTDPNATTTEGRPILNLLKEKVYSKLCRVWDTKARNNGVLVEKKRGAKKVVNDDATEEIPHFAVDAVNAKNAINAINALHHLPAETALPAGNASNTTSDFNKTTQVPTARAFKGNSFTPRTAAAPTARMYPVQVPNGLTVEALENALQVLFREQEKIEHLKVNLQSQLFRRAGTAEEL